MNKFYINGKYNGKEVIFLLKVGFTYFTVISIENIKGWTEKQRLKVGTTEKKCQKLIDIYHERFYNDRTLSNLHIITYLELLELLK